jgi:hypothetical protein
MMDQLEIDAISGPGLRRQDENSSWDEQGGSVLQQSAIVFYVFDHLGGDYNVETARAPCRRSLVDQTRGAHVRLEKPYVRMSFAVVVDHRMGYIASRETAQGPLGFQIKQQTRVPTTHVEHGHPRSQVALQAAREEGVPEAVRWMVSSRFLKAAPVDFVVGAAI